MYNEKKTTVQNINFSVLNRYRSWKHSKI